ncbi:MAG TPA: hypothetical protein VKF62_13365, partial [Planctomycetota bacterium]|nr:hypothetical protein [Planctomycetota bacterium]
MRVEQFGVAWVVLLAPLVAQESRPGGPRGDSISLEIATSDSALIGHGPSKSVPYTVSSSGT